LYVSFIIPAYRNAAILLNNVPVLQAHLQAKGYLYEILIVDDGSGDGGQTESAAAQLDCRFLANPRNTGKGAAVRRGMIAAKGQFRIFTDADIPFETDVIDRFLHYLDFKEFDVVVGDRTLAHAQYFEQIPLARKFASKIFSFVVGRFITTGMFDTQCGLKGFRAAIADDIFSVSKIDRFAFDVEIIYIALKRNYDIKRLPVQLRSQEGNSVSLMRHALNMLFDVLRIKYFHLKTGYRNPQINHGT